MGEARRRKLQAAKDQMTANPGPALWPLTNAVAQLELETWFADRGIDASKPGLHDTPQFLRAEAQDRKAMNVLARLVEARTYTADELKQAERRILVAAEATAHAVARDDRHGLCVVASGVLSRMLDELGIWNYTAKTNLAIRFPTLISTEPRYFFSIDEGKFVAPHAVVVAPPFTIIDVTVKHQRYDAPAMAQWLPALALTREFRPYRVSPAELVAPDIRAMMRRDGMTAERFLSTQRPAMLDFMRQVPPRELALDGGRLGYGLIAVCGYQARLPDLDAEACSLGGRTPIEIFEQDVLPQI